jgi:hydroxyethylthiazole kinase
MLADVRSKAPLVHCITNYVTVNDCANILIATGASPIMADDILEAEEITAICGGLVINIGTLNQHTIPSMLAAGNKANACHHPVIMDPVGAGASHLRTETAAKLLREVKFSVIRGNISEIKALALGSSTTKGVDADTADTVTNDIMEETIAFARRFSRETDAVIVITGAVDIVADAAKACVIYNGHPIMSKITGSGCMLTALTGAFIAANPDNILTAAAAAVSAMGVCGERAFQMLEKTGGGNSTYRNYLIDEVYNLTPEVLEAGSRYAFR